MTLDLMTALVGVIAAICTGMIPWAYSIHGRLRSIETKLETAANNPNWLEKEVNQNTKDVRELWMDIHEIKGRLKEGPE